MMEVVQRFGRRLIAKMRRWMHLALSRGPSPMAAQSLGQRVHHMRAEAAAQIVGSALGMCSFGVVCILRHGEYRRGLPSAGFWGLMHACRSLLRGCLGLQP